MAGFIEMLANSNITWPEVALILGILAILVWFIKE